VLVLVLVVLVVLLVVLLMLLVLIVLTLLPQMVADTTEVYSVMAVGHEWGWKQLKLGDPLLNGTGVWTISNRYVPGATNISATAIATARKDLKYTGTDADFDFGMVYGDQQADPSRQERSAGLLRDLAADHKLTKSDLMMTLSDHSHGGKENAHEPYVAQPHWRGSELDEHTEHGGLSASSMVSDFSTDAEKPRKIAWHSTCCCWCCCYCCCSCSCCCCWSCSC